MQRQMSRLGNVRSIVKSLGTLVVLVCMFTQVIVWQPTPLYAQEGASSPPQHIGDNEQQDEHEGEIIHTPTYVRGTNATQTSHASSTACTHPQAPEHASILPQYDTTSDLSYSTLSIIGGEQKTLALQGNVMYVAVGQQFHIVERSNPAKPLLQGKATLPYHISDLAVSGSYLYAITQFYEANNTCQTTTFFYVYDVSNPVAPTQIAMIQIPDSSIEMELYGHYIYISTGYGLSIVDVSNPLAPFEASYYEATNIYISTENNITFVGTYLYMAVGYGGLLILDVSNPLAPREVARYSDDNLFDKAFSVSSAGGYVYLGVTTGLVVLNVSNPAAPQYVTGLGGPPIYNSTIQGTLLYMASGVDGFVVIDISNPTSPTLVTNIDEGIRFANDVHIDGSVAYVSNQASTLIFDVSDVANPTMLGSYADTGIVTGIDVQGDYAYTTDLRTLSILDIQNPSAPTTIATAPLSSNQARSVEVSGSYAYVANDTDGLSIFDISNPLQPTLTATYTGSIVLRNFVIRGDYAYLANYYTTSSKIFEILDVSDPSNPQPVGNVITDKVYWAQDIAVQGTYAYMTTMTQGLIVIDISDPTNPQQVGSYSDQGTGALVVRDSYAYVSINSQRVILILDISTPTNPVLVGQFSTDIGDFFQCTTIVGDHIALIGNYLVVSDEDRDKPVIILDISTPTNPTFVAEYPVYRGTASILGMYDKLYVGGYDGLHIVQMTGSSIELPAAPTDVQLSAPNYCQAETGEFQLDVNISPDVVSLPLTLITRINDQEEQVSLNTTTWSGMLPCGSELGESSTITVIAQNAAGQASATHTIVAINEEDPPTITHFDLLTSMMHDVPNMDQPILADICTPYQIWGRLFTNGQSVRSGNYTSVWEVGNTTFSQSIPLDSLATEDLERTVYLGSVTLFEPISQGTFALTLTAQGSATALKKVSPRTIKVDNITTGGKNRVEACVHTFAEGMGKMASSSIVPLMHVVGIEMPQAPSIQATDVATSVLSLVVKNSEGKRVGFLQDGTILEEIPGSQVGMLDDDRVILYPDADGTTIHVTSSTTTTTSLYAGIAARDNSIILATHHDVSLGAEAQATLDMSEKPYPLAIDNDGDGKVDETLDATAIESIMTVEKVYLPAIVY